MPGLQGGKIQRPNPIFWEHEGNRAVREGKWKLVSKFPGKWELFDIPADRSEMKDQSEKEPATVSRLSGLYDQWAARVGAERGEVGSPGTSSGSRLSVGSGRRRGSARPSPAPSSSCPWAR